MRERAVFSTMIAAALLLAAAPAVAQQTQDAGQAAQSASAAQHEHQATSQGTENPPELAEQLEVVRAANGTVSRSRRRHRRGLRVGGGDGPLMGEHWVRRDMTDQPFDPAAPSTLQYLKTDGDYVLTGVAYTVYRAPDEPLPDGFAGETDVWHLHDMMKISMTATEGRPLLRWITERRIANGRTRWDEERPELTMVHAWTWLDNPDGVFAQDHRLIPYVRLGLPQAWGYNADVDAAYGVALLGDDACTLEARRTSFLAGTTWRQRSALTGACNGARAAVSAVFEGIDSADHSEAGGRQLNLVAQDAWRGYVARRAEILTDDQMARLAVGIEHPAGHGGR